MENQNENLQPDQTEVIENAVQVSKHCPNPDCMLYMLPQPNRTMCYECGAELVQ